MQYDKDKFLTNLKGQVIRKERVRGSKVPIEIKEAVIESIKSNIVPLPKTIAEKIGRSKVYVNRLVKSKEVPGVEMVNINGCSILCLIENGEI